MNWNPKDAYAWINLVKIGQISKVTKQNIITVRF